MQACTDDHLGGDEGGKRDGGPNSGFQWGVECPPVVWVWDGCKYALLTIWGKKGGGVRGVGEGVQLGGNGGLIGKCIQNGLRGWYTALPPQSSNPWGRALQEQSLFLPFSRIFLSIFLQHSCNIGVEFKTHKSKSVHSDKIHSIKSGTIQSCIATYTSKSHTIQNKKGLWTIYTAI